MQQNTFREKKENNGNLLASLVHRPEGGAVHLRHVPALVRCLMEHEIQHKTDFLKFGEFFWFL